MSLEIDEKSLLVSVPGAATLASIELALAASSLTLGIAKPDETAVAAWLTAGAPGAASLFADPSDHLVAGLTARLTNGRRLEIRPSPRRSVGPNLVALFLGAGERFGTIERAWLRVHRKGARRVAMSTEGLALDAPVSDGEAELLTAVEAELATTR